MKSKGIRAHYVIMCPLSLLSWLSSITYLQQSLTVAMHKANTSGAAADAYRSALLGLCQFMFIEGGIKSQSFE